MTLYYLFYTYIASIIGFKLRKLSFRTNTMNLIVISVQNNVCLVTTPLRNYKGKISILNQYLAYTQFSNSIMTSSFAV